jgi:predicted nucleotidyltransferase
MTTLTLPEDLHEKFGDALNALCAKYGIELVVLFGSRAQGRARPDSDYDVGVLCQRGSVSPGDYLELTYELGQALGCGNVDLVDLRAASPLLKYQAMSSGRPLYEATPGAFNLFYVLAWKMYQDARYDIYRLMPAYLKQSLRRWLG